MAPHYQCILTREGPLDELTIAVEAGPGLHHEHADVRSAADRLAHEVKVYIGNSCASGS